MTGTVHGGVVSVFGNTYIDGPVQEAAVAVFGDFELGPNAGVEGDIAVVAGKLTRDPQAVVSGHSEIMAGAFRCRRRAPVDREMPALRAAARVRAGAWLGLGLAFGFLLFYVVMALMFDRSGHAFVETLETRRGSRRWHRS